MAEELPRVPTEPFTYVFIAAVVLFFAFYLLIGQEPMDEEGTPLEKISQGGDIIFSKSYINLLSNRTQSVRTVDFGDFVVGFSKSDKVIEEIDSITIENGLFTSETKKFSFDRSDLEKAVIDFKVDDTNSYGNLRIYFNDELIFDDKAVPGSEYNLELNGLEGTNTVRLEAESSGAKIWAPTTYIIKDLEVSASYFSNSDKMYSFDVYDYELTGFDAMLSYEVSSESIRDGDFYIEINGNEINEQKRPIFGTPYKETFDRSDGVIASKPDPNYIRFYADDEARYDVRDAQLTISYFDSDQAAISEQSFKITDEVYDDMENETIVLEYYAEKVSEDKPLEIYFNNDMIKHETELYENQIFLDRDDFRPHRTNVLKFSTFGIYKLEDVDIRIVDEDTTEVERLF